MVVMVAVALGFAAYHKQNGLADVFELEKAIVSLDDRIIAVKDENDRLRMELLALETSDLYIESIARESLGLVKPGETVYEFLDSEN